MHLAASLTLTALTDYQNPNGYDTTYFQASGGGILDLPELAGLGSLSSILDIQALTDGQLILSLLATITETSPYVQIEASGTGSEIDLPALTSFAGNPSFAVLSDTGDAQRIDPELNQFTDVNLTTDSTVAFDLASNQTYTTSPGATVSVTTGSLVEQGSQYSRRCDNQGERVAGDRRPRSLVTDISGQSEYQWQPARPHTNADEFTPFGTVSFDSGAGVLARHNSSRRCLPIWEPSLLDFRTTSLMARSV